MVTQHHKNFINDLSVASKILGINVSGNKTVAVYGDMNGLLYERMQMESISELPFLEGFDAICGLADKLLKICRAQGLSSPEIISMAVSGPVDLVKGMVLSPPDLPKWHNVPLKGRLGVRYNLPILMEHRSHAAALAEHYFGAAIGLNDVLLLDLEPVVTMGMILGNKTYHGTRDAAGDIGRMRMTADGPAGLFEPGSLTGYASGLGMAELASLRFPERWPEAPQPYELVKAVNDGEEKALAVVAEAAEHLGRALVWLIFTLDPEIVILGHPGDVLKEALLTPLREAVLRFGGGEASQLPRLVVSKLGGKLDDTAALMAVIHRFKNNSGK